MALDRKLLSSIRLPLFPGRSQWRPITGSGHMHVTRDNFAERPPLKFVAHDSCFVVFFVLRVPFPRQCFWLKRKSVTDSCAFGPFF